MPLSRYEITSEYSLANPDLYRAADKDDPEGLLEGVAMAGLVGIIRQLGDLAEFAAEVFHDLHEDVLAIAARGHELIVRVRQLETEVPLVEKRMLTRIDNGKCFYNSGIEWHARIYNDQNHFTQGDLPRFIRTAYEDCRSPPRLFPLDRFDVTGAGSCLKRFSDPSFFKTEWANAELMKAEKEQQDQKARRMKRKGGQQQAYRKAREAKIASDIQLRVTMEADYAEILRTSSSSNSSLGSRQGADDLPVQENDATLLASGLLASGLLVSEEEGLQKMEHATLDTARHMDASVKDLKNDKVKDEVVADDSASETDNFMDAVTTMDSEVETDSEMKARAEMVGELLVEVEEVKAPAPPSQPPPELCRGADEEHNVIIEEKVCPIIERDKEGLVREGDTASGNHTSEMLLNAEHVQFDDVSETKVLTEEEGFSSLVDDSAIATLPQDKETSIPDSGSDTPVSETDIALPGRKEDTVSKAEGHPIDNTLTVLAEEEDISVVIQSAVMLAVKDNISSSTSKSNLSLPGLEEDAGMRHLQSESNASSPGLQEDAVLDSERNLQSGSTSLVLETPEIVVPSKDLPQRNQLPLSDIPSNNISQTNSPEFFNQHPESDSAGKDIPLSTTPEDPSATSTRKRWQISKLFTKEFLASDLERDGLQVSESEQSESPRKLSSHSSPSSSIQPMKWAGDMSKTYHTDDEMEEMQVSSASPSSSSSAVSSPRPSTLATILPNASLEGQPQKSAESSLQSPRSSSSKSGTHQASYRVNLQGETTAEPPMSPTFGGSVNSSPRSSSSIAQPFFDPSPASAFNVNISSIETANNLENFPPPPPLPPLAWRITRKPHSTVVNSLRPMESPTSIPIPCDVQETSNNVSQAFTSSNTLPTVPDVSSVKPAQPTHGFSPLTIGERSFQKSAAMVDESSTYETGLSDLESLHGRSADPHGVLKSAKSHDRGPPAFNLKLGMVEQGTVSVLAMSHSKGENVVTEGPDSSLQEKFVSASTHVTLSSVVRTGSIPARLDESRLGLQSKAAVEYESAAFQRSDLPNVLTRNLERRDFTEATTSDDVNTLKKRSKWAWTSSTASSDDREVLLDQIRTRSFSLRNTSREKLPAPRPVTNINVAAILEKANSIRQAFAGSDDDDEWSDT